MKKRRVVEIFTSSLLCLSLLTACSNSVLKQEAKDCYELTEGELTEVEIAQVLGADISYINCGFKNAEFVRTLVTKEKPIYLVPSEKYLEFSKSSVKNLVEELNNIFLIINPDIKFVYQETLPNSENNILTIDVADELDSTGVTYMQEYVKKGNDVYNYDCSILINKNHWIANFLVDLDTLLAHEVAHALGLGHSNEQTTVPTIMNCEGSCGPNGYYTLNDMYNFAVLYGGYNNKEEVLSVKNKLDSYYKNLEDAQLLPGLSITKPLFKPKGVNSFEFYNKYNNYWNKKYFNNIWLKDNSNRELEK